MPDQRAVTEKGASMRLGAYQALLKKKSAAYQAYKSEKITERHRHRYEFNNDFRDVLTKHGLLISGVSSDERLVEIIEIPAHPWFIGVQFHPELTSRAVTGHPLFTAFIRAAQLHTKEA